MASLGLPFQGKLWYWIEDSYGDGPTGSALPVSVRVMNVRLGLADKHKTVRGFDSPNATLIEQCNDFTLHVEYIPQCGDTLLDDANTRVDCLLNSLCFYLETNSCSSVTDDKSIWLCKGAKCKTTRISASHNTEYVLAMDFSLKSAPTDDGSAYSEPTALSGELCAFNIAGSINDGTNPLAYILDSIDITIDNGVKDHYDHDSLDKQYSIEGEVGLEGSCDISLDEGGSEHLSDVLAQADFDIVVNMGDSGCPKITLSSCKWKSSEIPADNGGDIMKESAPFTGVTFTIDTVT